MILAALLAVPASAQNSRESPGRIGPIAATSVCVGSAATPSCAAETLLACLTRGDAALCRVVGVTTPPRPADEPLQSEYVLERESIIRPEDVTDDLRDLDWFKPGYALVEAQRRMCPAADANCGGESWEYLQVYLRPREGAAAPGWEIVTWRSDSEPDMAPELPDDFTRRSPGP